MKEFQKILVISAFLVVLLSSGCGSISDRQSTKTADAATKTAVAWTKTPTSTTTSTVTITPTATLTRTLHPMETKYPTWTPMAVTTEIPCMYGWERYEGRTMGEVIDFHLAYGDLDEVDENEIHIEMSPAYQYPSRVVVTYGDEFREIGEHRRMIITAQLSTFAPNLTEEQRNEIYQEEVLFLDGENEYWIPVQSQLVDFMHDELETGDAIVIYILYLGATWEEREVVLLFAVNAWQ